MRLLALFAVVYVATCDAQTRFPNARYLGMGYNIVKGNPDNNLHDPGFTFPVLKLTWTTDSMTSDNKFQIPDHIQALQTKSCSFQSEAASEFGAKSYQSSLSSDVSAEGDGSFGLWSARFSASVGYQSVSEATSQRRRVYVSARGRCIAYELAVNYATAPIEVHDNFARDVKALPLHMDNDAYITLFNRYGTHFTTRTTMGAKMVVRSEFTEEAYSEIESSGVSVAASAQLSYASFASGSVSSETESEREHREEFESKRSLHSEAYLGSHPPSDGNWQTWATSSEESSFPVVYKLVPIVSLLEEKFFPDMPEGNLTTRRHLLAGAYDIYCSSTAECQTPGQDRKPILTSKVATRIHGTAKVACVNGYNLLSCGMQANTKSKGYDLKRHAVPHSSTECECSDQHDSQCIPWCTNANVNFEIKHSSVHGSADVYCPHGYKVSLIFRSYYGINVCLFATKTETHK